MGKAVPKRIKLIARQLMEKFPDKFSAKNFDKNKEFINSLTLPIAKHTRNLVAGYITRLKGTEEKD
ncbi:MAG: 30S ribosomal protein S17e [Candidatus Diapherotrites archaeon]